MQLYQPQNTVSGPTYSTGFKSVATVICTILAAYGASVVLRFPLMQFGFGLAVSLACAALLLAISCYWFLRSTTTIDDKGIRQTGMHNKQVEWRNVSAAKLIGIPFMSWLFPPRLVVRTGNSIATFNGGTREMLIEFTKIALAFNTKR
ncbi:hypothetical protein D3870_17210 [Noviherbaspirillum cavernae]|uniref:Uncharacterized protein n=1 Tax=Noviherbaspirillum cavernae TaxID=2320862 RepID=A0A418X6P5_9BURK|nr:hypothetical protein [Noviherbaspirillum cavernae]RJG08157.1 hypothetical protein D3870_17210 [Noviherbaspirillum cavernae]